MADIIANIKELGIPTGSHFDAQRFIKAKYDQAKLGNDIKSGYEYLIGKLTGTLQGEYDTTIQFNSAKEAELVFSYMVIDTVKAYNETAVGTIDEVLEGARQKTETFLKKNVWIITNGDVLDVQGQEGDGVKVTTTTGKKREGPSKKDQAIALFKKDGNNTKTRKELIPLFVEKLGLTEKGASTYVHNVMKGLWK